MVQQPLVAEQIRIPEVQVPREPPPEFEFTADPPSISAFDLYVKQFVFSLFYEQNYA